ncbi:hypothetical protein AAHB34_00535 [Paenarthrobacter ureafaciens]
MRTVERLTFHVQDITDVLQSVIWEEGAGTVIPDSVLSNLSEALESVADVIDRWRSDEEPELEPASAEARDCVAALGDAINEAAAGQASVNAAASVAMSLRRMVTVLSSD